MNKEKKIEEMARVIDDRLLEARNYLGSMNRGEGYWIAQKLIDFYQPKVNENEVVINKEEYEGLISQNKGLKEENHTLRLENNDLEAENNRLYEMKLDLENQIIEKGWADCEGADEIEKRVSKETAVKIYAYVNCFGTHNWERFKNFLKQFGVEVGE